MVHGLNDLALQQILQFFQIHHHARYRVGIAFKRHFQDVIMAVSGA